MDHPHSPEEADLVGWDVVEVGIRQVHPFVGLASPGERREVRVYIDSDFAILPSWPTLHQDSDEVLPALGELLLEYVTAVSLTESSLDLQFESARLVISREGNLLTTHDSWWIGVLG